MDSFDPHPPKPPTPPPFLKRSFRDRFQKVGSFLSTSSSKLKSMGWAKNLPERLSEIDPQVLLDWVASKFQKQKVTSYGKALVVILCTYFLADLTALLIGRYIPEPPPARVMTTGRSKLRPKSIEDYQIIFSRNLFNSRGIIPGEQGAPGQGVDGPPVKTNLPFNLVGTLVLADELKSIASIEDKTAAQVYPVRIDDEIPQKAKILKIEANKVIFMNVQSGRKEYVDLPEDDIKISIAAPTRAEKGPGIEKNGNNYSIARNEVDKALADPVTLTQARCLPALENGVSVGFRCFQIVPGSIYEKIGMQNNDVITSINGQALSDPSQAITTLMNLKNESRIELNIRRNGRPMSFAYDIR